MAGGTGAEQPVTMLGPDFPFAFDDHVRHPAGLGRMPAERYGTEVAVIRAGISGIVTALEMMKLGLRPVVYEADRIGGRLRSEPFKGGDGTISPRWAPCASRPPRRCSTAISTLPASRPCPSRTR
jgi:tryptophan 2-monooxygenase